MSDLIEALQIFAKYTNSLRPIDCCHDILFVHVSPDIVSEEDKKRLSELSFIGDEPEDSFKSFRFGSC